MRTLYLELNMGAAGDMLSAALLELLPKEKQEEVLSLLNSLFPGRVHVDREQVTRCGILGTHLKVTVDGQEEESLDIHDHHEHHDHEHHHNHDHEDHHDHDHDHEHHHHHHHTSMAQIEEIVKGLSVDDAVKTDILAVYHLLAEAEGHAHGMPVDEIHFHEVGSLDAVTDITAVCLLVHEIAPDEILASPVHTGQGQVRCAHGILPVPTPATEYLLRGIPTYTRENVTGELCTPTGAALLKYFVRDFGQRPLMKVEETGYGCGNKEFDEANVVRAFLGERMEEHTDTVTELNCNLDDMTAEEIGFATEQLFAAGAREVFTAPIYMKKNRPGTLLTVITDSEHEEVILSTIFKHTTTIGVRKTICERAVLKRSEETQDTPEGPVRVKTSTGFGMTRTKLEYDDIAAIAKKEGKSLREVEKEILQ